MADNKKVKYSPNKPRKPTKNQIRYYYSLCREVGIPNELATQQQIYVYNTYERLDERIQELLLMKKFKKKFEENRSQARSIFWVLCHTIEREAKKLIEERKKTSWLTNLDIENCDLTIKDKFKFFLASDSEKNKKNFLYNNIIMIFKQVFKRFLNLFNK